MVTGEREGHARDGRLAGLIDHSDAGSQYVSIRYSERLADAGAAASIGTVGDSYDNAQIESLIGLYKLECVRPEGPWRDVDALELATLNWVHWFNEHRLHSALSTSLPPNSSRTITVRPTTDNNRSWESRQSLNRGRSTVPSRDTIG